MALSEITIDPARTAIAIGYKQPGLIADQVLPRVPVEGMIYKYEKYSLEQSFDVVDDVVGARGKVKQATLSSESVTGQVKDYALDFPLTQEELAAKAPTPAMDRRTRAMKSNLARILRNREKRVADLVFNENTYPAANKTTLTGTGQWSHADSTPLTAIRTAAEGMVVWPNTLVVSGEVLFKLQRNKEIVAAVYNAQTSNGFVPIEALKELFQVENILVGRGFYNAAAKGKTFNKQAYWGKHAALLYLSDQLNGDDATFGFTAQFGTRYAGEINDPDVGMRGGVRFRVGESLDEHITCPALGYFFKNAIA